MTGIQVVSIGEVLIEFTRAKDGRFNLSCDGDTFNTAVYLARAGINTAYATALGEDPYSEGLVSLAGVENISTDLILRSPGRLPGVHCSGAKQRPRVNCLNCPTGPASPRR